MQHTMLLYWCPLMQIWYCRILCRQASHMFRMKLKVVTSFCEVLWVQCITNFVYSPACLCNKVWNLPNPCQWTQLSQWQPHLASQTTRMYMNIVIWSRFSFLFGVNNCHGCVQSLRKCLEQHTIIWIVEVWHVLPNRLFTLAGEIGH